MVTFLAHPVLIGVLIVQGRLSHEKALYVGVNNGTPFLMLGCYVWYTGEQPMRVVQLQFIIPDLVEIS